MSELAKKARAAMKAKAQRLGKDRPLERVDSADWTPPELLNADVKTGLRPVSRRAFKKGGKVVGDCSAPRADRKPRKSGGKTEAVAIANAKVNRNVKDANEEREGKKHIGGMKKGGRAEKLSGGALARYAKAASRKGDMAARMSKDDSSGEMAKYANKRQAGVQMALSKMQDKFADKDASTYKKGGRAKYATQGGVKDYSVTGTGTMTKGGKDVTHPSNMRPIETRPTPPVPQRPQREPEKGMSGEEASKFMEGRKKGGKVDKKTGRSKKMLGGPMMNPGQVLGSLTPAALGGGNAPQSGGTGATPTQPDPRMFMVSPKSMEFGQNVVTPGLKKGGKVKHSDEAMDKALIKKMVKPEARTGKASGGKQAPRPTPQQEDEIRAEQLRGIRSMLGKPKRDGGRTARATGGRTKGKGKTNINIVIAAGKPQAPGMGPMDMPPPPMGGPGAAPIPVPPPKAAGPQAAPMPMPVPMPMPIQGGPGGPPPMPRKSGGRVSKVAKSYKDMEAGAGSGEGRLQKTDIAKRQPKPGFQKGDNVYSGKGYPNAVTGATGGRTAKKAGGKVYRSYKDMDAGAGSGLGRLEKTQIESRKH
jgi:hypothetical protein